MLEGAERCWGVLGGGGRYWEVLGVAGRFGELLGGLRVSEEVRVGVGVGSARRCYEVLVGDKQRGSLLRSVRKCHILFVRHVSGGLFF